MANKYLSQYGGLVNTATHTWADSGTLTTAGTGDYYTYGTGSIYVEPMAIDPYEWKKISGSVSRIIEPKKGDENMRYLYEVILVNPKNDSFDRSTVVAKSETSALMKAYKQAQEMKVSSIWGIEFDDLKTSCKILMSWEKEKSLNKAIETIKKAVE